MKKATRALVALLILTVDAYAAAPDRDVLRAANWLVGSFDNRAQAAADRTANSPYQHEVVTMVGRPVQDPVEFLDALYVYVETRRDGESRPDRQRVYRLKK